MKTNFSKLMAVIQLLTALAVLGAKFIWAPVCEHMLTLANGSMTHMKCYYTAQAVMALSVILLIAAGMAFFAGEDYSKFQIIIISIGILIFFIPTSMIIGICAKAEMPCHLTAAWIRGAAAVTVIAGIIGLLRGRPSQLQIKD